MLEREDCEKSVAFLRGLEMHLPKWDNGVGIWVECRSFVRAILNSGKHGSVPKRLQEDPGCQRLLGVGGTTEAVDQQGRDSLELLDQRQITSVCVALLKRSGLAHFWNQTSLLEEAIELLQVPGERVSKEEQAVLLLVWRLSNGRSKVPPETDVTVFGDNNRSCIDALLVALKSGSAAVEQWLREHAES